MAEQLSRRDILKIGAHLAALMGVATLLIFWLIERFFPKFPPELLGLVGLTGCAGLPPLAEPGGPAAPGGVPDDRARQRRPVTHGRGQSRRQWRPSVHTPAWMRMR